MYVVRDMSQLSVSFLTVPNVESQHLRFIPRDTFIECSSKDDRGACPECNLTYLVIVHLEPKVKITMMIGLDALSSDI